MYMAVIINIMIQSILCRYNTGGSTNMTLLSTDWICDIKQTQQYQPNNLIHYHSNWTTVNPLKMVFSPWILLRGCWVDIVEFVSYCKFSLWISVSCFYYHQYYTGTQLTKSVTLDDKGTMQLSGGLSRLLDRPSLLNRAFNHFKL